MPELSPDPNGAKMFAPPAQHTDQSGTSKIIVQRPKAKLPLLPFQKQPPHRPTTQPTNKTTELEHCRCKLTMSISHGQAHVGGIDFTKTTCGKDAYRRGKGQKIVAFAFYGDMKSGEETQRGYFKGKASQIKHKVPIFCYTVLLFICRNQS